MSKLKMEKLFTIKQMSERTGIPVPSLYRYAKQNKIPHIKLGRLYFKPDALDDLETRVD